MTKGGRGESVGEETRMILFLQMHAGLQRTNVWRSAERGGKEGEEGGGGRRRGEGGLAKVECVVFSV